MVVFKACPRCHGDLILEAFPGDVEYACLQCGYRMAAWVFSNNRRSLAFSGPRAEREAA